MVKDPQSDKFLVKKSKSFQRLASLPSQRGPPSNLRLIQPNYPALITRVSGCPPTEIISVFIFTTGGLFCPSFLHRSVL